MLQVDRVRVSIAWLSWWRGRGMIDSASISNAEVQLSHRPEETADFHEVNADVAFDGKDIKIENAQARFLDFALSVRGTIHNDGFPVAARRRPTQQTAARAGHLALGTEAIDDIGIEQPIDVQSSSRLRRAISARGRANFALDGRHLTWRTAPVDEFSIRGTLNDGVVGADRFQDRPRARRTDRLRRMEPRRPHRRAAIHLVDGFHHAGAGFPGAARPGAHPARFRRLGRRR